MNADIIQQKWGKSTEHQPITMAQILASRVMKSWSAASNLQPYRLYHLYASQVPHPPLTKKSWHMILILRDENGQAKVLISAVVPRALLTRRKAFKSLDMSYTSYTIDYHEYHFYRQAKERSGHQ